MTMPDNSSLASASVSEQRLWNLLMDVAVYGATEKGGVNRQALSQEDVSAKSHVVRWAEDRGFQCFQDDIGNLFVRREGTEPALDPVMTGSHLDSQPTGGRFDGAYGVLAGLEVLDALNDANIQTRRPIEIVAWTNEEGSRFSPGAMGSSVFAGVRPLGAVLDVTDPSGIALKDALAATLAAVPLPQRKSDSIKPYCYVESHIEQGPILEEKNQAVGVVSGIQGIRRLNISVAGEEAHAGTTPRRSRKDAFASTVAIISALEKLTADDDDTLRFTVGRCEVLPGSPNTVPGRVHFTIDLRHPDIDLLRSIGDRIHAVATETGAPCLVDVADISFVAPTEFDRNIMAVIGDAADRLAYSHITMPSGAGHDAMHMSNICPTGMIFIPCLRGISHNEAESATAADLAAGTRVLADAIVHFANQ
jgi:N-carbamoyl-L-amino-acid hydrolase